MSKKGMGMGMGMGKGGDDEDTSTEDLQRLYKKNCAKSGITPLKAIEEKFNYIFDEGDGILEQLHIWDETGPVGIRCFCDALRDVKYAHLKSMRFWKANAQDEGIRSACDFLKLGTSKVTIFDVLSNNISPLGCEFIGNMLPTSSLTILKLDHNNIGSAGLAEIARGLSKNSTLLVLSLAYCGIDAEGAKYLQQILAYVKTELKMLDLQGNNLRNEGVKELFRVLKVNESLEEINLADNQFGEEALERICDVMATNKNLGIYDLNYNAIYDTGAEKILSTVKTNTIKWIYKIFLNDRIHRDIIKELHGIIKKNKKKKKKGKKKKKKD